MSKRPGRPISVKVSGGRELRRDLRRAGAKSKDLTRPNRQLAKTFAPTAAGRAPVGKTGRLAASVRGLGTTTKAIIAAGSASVPYAGPIHFGWPTRPNAGRGWRGGPISPNPFIYDVIDERRDEIIAAYQAEMDRLMREVDP